MERDTVLIGIPCLMVGGTEVQTLRLVEALVDGGYHVVVACYYEHSADMVAQYEATGARVEPLSTDGTRPAGTRAQFLFLLKGLRRLVRQHSPAVAHVQYMAPGALPIVALRLLGVRHIVATSHTMADIYRSPRLVRFLQRHLLRAFTCITLSAEESFFGTAQAYSEDLPLRRRNHFTIYNTLPAAYPMAQRSPAWDRPRIGFVSRMERIKGADLVLPAFAELKRLLPEASLTVVGDGSMKALMQEQQQALGVEVDWLPRQPFQQLPAIYRQMDILWMPSRSEGFGLTAIEALAQGCLVVGARTGGLPELLRHDAFLCTPEDPSSLAATTLALVRSPQTPPPIEAYRFERYRDQILSLYAKLLPHHV